MFFAHLTLQLTKHKKWILCSKIGITLALFIFKKGYFYKFDFEVDLLTFRMTLNHQTNTRNELSRQVKMA